METLQVRSDQIGEILGLHYKIYIKREDLHPYGSHKGRSIPFMMDKYIEAGQKNFVISSSGNAALAACIHAKKKDVELDVYVGMKIPANKFERLSPFQSEKIRIHQVERPLQEINQKTEQGYRSLRQSLDDTALLGYRSLANELSEIPDLKHIFIGTSSGTATQALHNFLNKEDKKDVSIHIVQTTSCNPMATALGSMSYTEEISIADAIVDKAAHRLIPTTQAVRDSGGEAYIVSNEVIKNALELLNTHIDKNISPNGALGLAGLMEAIYSGADLDGNIAVIVCGQ